PRGQYVRGNAVAGAGFLGDDRADAGKMHRRIGVVSGDRIMGALRVVVSFGMHGTYDGKLVHALRDLVQKLGNLNAWDAGRDRLERRIRFGIPCVDMTRPAFQPQKYDRLRPSTRGAGGRGAKVLRQVDAQNTEGAYAYEVTARSFFARQFQASCRLH